MAARVNLAIDEIDFQVAAFSQRGLRGEVTLSQEGSAVKVLNIDPDHDPPVYFSS